MLPAGYMAKVVRKRLEWLQAPHVDDVYSIGGCISHDFAGYIEHWKHNGHWLFNSPEVIREVAEKESVDLRPTSLFYYEVHEREFDGEKWTPYGPDPSFVTNVVVPASNQLGGFDVATFSCRNVPEHSPLSCNRLAKEIATNAHCLLSSFEQAKTLLEGGAFDNSEPGPYRIFAVYSVNWP